MKVEFLIILKEDDNFCNSKETFVNLLRTNANLSVDGSQIEYSFGEKIAKYKYQLFTDRIQSKGQRYFHLVLHNDTTTGDAAKDVEQFNSLVRSIKDILQRVNSDNSSIDIIWDDISYYYSLQAYPLINEIENLMRKLIIKFMVVNVGIEWMHEATPVEVKDKIERRGARSKGNLQSMLYETDFIQLSEFLFKKYRTSRLISIDSHLSNVTNQEQLDFELLKNYVPKSNWERYFEGKLEYSAENLQAEWDELYQLRNKIAHNRGIAKGDLSSIKSLAEKIRAALLQAIDKLEKGNIEITEDQKQEIILEVETSQPNNEDIVINALRESDAWLKNKQKLYPNSFLGYNYFINTLLVPKGIHAQEAVNILRSLAERGVINIYKHTETHEGYHPLTAIKFVGASS